MARGYVQKITRKQALSYERLIPNGIGVTTLAAVNGRGAAKRAASPSYASRYAATQAVLRGYAPAVVPVYEVGGESGSTRRAVANARKAATKTRAKKPGSKQMAAKKRTAKKGKRGASKRKLTKAERKKISLRNLAKARAARKTAGKAKSKRSTKRGAAKRPAAKKRRGKRADAWKTMSYKTVSVSKKGKRKTSKTHKVPLLRARVGRKTFKTFMTPGKGGRVRHVPLYVLQGFGSEKERVSFMSSSDPKLAKRQQQLVKIAERVKKARERSAGRVMLHGDMFTPNATMTYGEWSESMRANKSKKKKAKKAGKKSKLTKAQRSAAAKKAARTRKRNMTAKVRKTAAPKKRKSTSAKRSAAAKKAARTRKRNLAAKSQKRSGGKKGKRSAAKRSKRGFVTLIVRGKTHRYKANRRRRHSYRRNGFAGLMPVLKTGVVVGAGLLLHRVLRRVIDDNVTSEIGALNTGSVLGYRSLIAGALTAIVGVGVAEFAKGKVSADAKGRLAELQGGMIASVVLDLIGAALKDQPKALPYFSGMGEYVPMSGLGSYYQMRGVNGFGALTQAAAGFGAPMMQAAAGFGAPQLTQAAAGMGEFFVPGARGVGEYVETPFNRRLAIGALDDGIAPTVGAAEHALTIAEAAAGVGNDGWGEQWGDTATDFQSIVDPTQYALAVSQPDAAFEGGGGVLTPFVNANMIDNVDPNDDGYGLRSGVLQGVGGIFG